MLLRAAHGASPVGVLYEGRTVRDCTRGGPAPNAVEDNPPVSVPARVVGAPVRGLRPILYVTLSRGSATPSTGRLSPKSECFELKWTCEFIICGGGAGCPEALQRH